MVEYYHKILASEEEASILRGLPAQEPASVIRSERRYGEAFTEKGEIFKRVRTQVVVVVVVEKERLFLVTSVICVRFRGYHNSLRHSFRFSSKTAFLP